MTACLPASLPTTHLPACPPYLPPCPPACLLDLPTSQCRRGQRACGGVVTPAVPPLHRSVWLRLGACALLGCPPCSPTHLPAASSPCFLGFSAAGTVDHSLLLETLFLSCYDTILNPTFCSGEVFCQFSLSKLSLGASSNAASLPTSSVANHIHSGSKCHLSTHLNNS